MSDDEQTSEGPQVIKCRGLPWSATADEIAEFFSECNLMDGSDSIHLTTTKDGRPSGEAYVEMASEEDLEQALKKNRENMGKRYVEVYKVPKTEMDEVIANNGVIPESGPSNSDNVVRLRGLPYEATKQDVYNFFEGLQITNNGILLTTDYQGRASGEAFVQFTSDHHVEKALTKNKQTMGHRYIEVFKSSMMEAQRSQMKDSFRGGRGGGGAGGGMMRGGRPGPYDRMGPGGPGGRGGAYGGGGGGNFGPAGRGSRNFKSFGGGGGGGGGGGDNYYGNDNYAAPGGFGGYGPGPVGPGAGGPPGGRHVVRMRGLPFRVTENDIAEWFSSVVDPIDICIRSNNQGRPTGEADVLFSSEADARRAMSKDKQNMQHRYVELFYDGPVGGGGGGGMGMGGGGMGGGGMGMGGGGGGGMGGGAPPMRGYSSGNSYGGYNNY